MFDLGISGRSRVATYALMGVLALAVFGIEAFIGLQSTRFGDNEAVFQIGTMLALAALAAYAPLVKIEFGILLLPIVAVAAPFSVGTGTQSVLVAVLILGGYLIAIWVARMFLRLETVKVGAMVTVPALGFLVVAILATIWSNVERPAIVAVWPTFGLVQLATLGVFIVSVGILLLVMHNVREMRWIEYLVWILMVLGAVTVAGYFLHEGRDLPGVRVGGLFSMWVIALAYGQALFNHRMPYWGRAGLLLLAAVWVYRRFFLESSWLSGWLPALVAIVVISILRPRPLSLLVLVAVAVAGLAQFDYIYATQVLSVERGGNFLRLEIWAQNLELIKDHLLLGTGAGGYAPYYMAFSRDQAYSSHSNYLDICAQTGLIGSFFFLWLLTSLGIVGFRARRKWTTGFAAGFVNGAIGALMGLAVAMALGDWLIPFAYNQTIAGFRHTVHSWIILGALASLLYSRSE
ncbi:MAG: O-antigen ligase family protein [Chloroflexota bacterium]